MSDTPPGWYPDAQGTIRWFDGQQWTEHTQAPAPQMPPAPQAPQPPQAPQGSDAPTAWTPTYAEPAAEPGNDTSVMPAVPPSGQQWAPMPPPPGGAEKSRTPLVVLGIIAALLLVGIAVVAVLLLTGDDDGDDKASPSDDTTSDTSAPTDSPLTVTSPPLPDPSSDVPTIPAPTSPPTSPPTSDPGDPDDGTPVSDGSPEDVAERFTEALITGDCHTAKRYLSDQAPAFPDDCGDMGVPEGLPATITATAKKAKIHGDEAEVPVTLGAEGIDLSTVPGATFIVKLAREDGEWRVTDVSQ